MCIRIWGSAWPIIHTAETTKMAVSWELVKPWHFDSREDCKWKSARARGRGDKSQAARRGVNQNQVVKTPNSVLEAGSFSEEEWSSNQNVQGQFHRYRSLGINHGKMDVSSLWTQVCLASYPTFSPTHLCRGPEPNWGPYTIETKLKIQGKS